MAMASSRPDHLCPAFELLEVKLRQHVRLGCRKNTHPANPSSKGMTAGFQLGQHAAADDRICNEGWNLLSGEPWHHRPLSIFYSRHIGEKDQCIGMPCNRTLGSHLVRIHVVIFAICTQRKRG